MRRYFQQERVSNPSYSHRDMRAQPVRPLWSWLLVVGLFLALRTVYATESTEDIDEHLLVFGVKTPESTEGAVAQRREEHARMTRRRYDVPLNDNVTPSATPVRTSQRQRASAAGTRENAAEMWWNRDSFVSGRGRVAALQQPANWSSQQQRNAAVRSRSGSGSINSNRRKTAPTTTTTTTSTTSTTTTTPRPSPFSNFQLSNPFSLFPQTLWNLSNPPNQHVSTKRPPKKYKHSPSQAANSLSSKEQKLAYQKPKHAPKPTKPSPATTTTTTTRKANVDGPFRIALPTLNFLGVQSTAGTDEGKGKRATETEHLRDRFTCPRESEVRFQLFPKICKTDKDCTMWNREELCCEIFGAKSCVSGIAKPLEEAPHAPILGLIPRKCPTRPLAELWWEVKECNSDMDCWPRVCCPDGRRRYCRTSQPELETAPVPVKRSFNYLTEYLECTPPPPPIFDLHPKACTSTLDCFPNVCCQEAGLRHCRPPKKSVLTLMANFLNVDFVKRLTQNIVIK